MDGDDSENVSVDGGTQAHLHVEPNEPEKSTAMALGRVSSEHAAEYGDADAELDDVNGACGASGC